MLQVIQSFFKDGTLLAQGSGLVYVKAEPPYDRLVAAVDAYGGRWLTNQPVCIQFNPDTFKAIYPFADLLPLGGQRWVWKQPWWTLPPHKNASYFTGSHAVTVEWEQSLPALPDLDCLKQEGFIHIQKLERFGATKLSFFVMRAAIE